MNCFGSGNKSRIRNPSVPTPDFDKLEKITPFSKKELISILHRFEEISDQQTGLLDKDSFLSMPEVAFCPIAELVFEKETTKVGRSCLDFIHFTLVMGIFSAQGRTIDKVKCKIMYTYFEVFIYMKTI